MSEQSEVAQGVWNMVGAIALKTAAATSSVGAVEAAAKAVPALSPMDVPLLFGFTGSNLCQIAGTAYIVGLVIVALIKKYKQAKKLNKKLFDFSIMGGNGSNGP